jgi:hypothetical protein
MKYRRKVEAVNPQHQIEVLKLQLQGAQEQRDEALKTVEELTKERKDALEENSKLFNAYISNDSLTKENKYLNSVIISQAKTIHELGQS